MVRRNGVLNSYVISDNVCRYILKLLLELFVIFYVQYGLRNPYVMFSGRQRNMTSDSPECIYSSR